MIHAGAAERYITPPVGTSMLEPPGMPTTGIHTPLTCRALVLDDGRERVALVTLDLLGMDPPLVAATQAAVLARTGIPGSHLMLTATHNHSAPVTLDCGQDDQRNRDWERDLVGNIAQTVAQAADAPQPVTVAYGREAVQIGVNRRVSIMGRTRMLSNPYAPVIAYVDALRFECADGTLMAVLFSHAAHPVTVHTAATLFNADYPGFACEMLREALGRHVLPMFAQGCAGDINVESLAGGLAEAERLGRVLGAAALRAVEKAQPLVLERLRVANFETTLPFDTIAPGTLDALEATIHASVKALPLHDDDPRSLHDQRMLLQWVERVRHAPPGLPFRVQGVAFDDRLALLGMTHELFAAYGQRIVAESPFAHTLAFAYTNGCNGYVPTADAYYLGGYEVDGAAKLFGLPRLRPACEQEVYSAVHTVLKTLRQQGGPAGSA